MSREDSDKTISLWEGSAPRSITLKNRKSGERFSFVLRHDLVLGRLAPPSDLQITKKDMYISGKHVRFENMNHEVYVNDLNSKNGTWINGKLISSRTRLRQGDVLKLGRSEFDVTIG